MRLVFFDPESPTREYIVENDQQPLGIGAKSKVYRAIPGETTHPEDNQYVIKISGNPEDEKKELDIIQQIFNKGGRRFVPDYREIKDKTTGQEALLIEYMPNDHQATNDNIVQLFRDDQILLNFIKQNHLLLQVIHDELGISVSDRKANDYYWMPGDRLVVLDWNIFDRLENFSERDQRIKKENGYKNLAANLFRILFSDDIPSKEEKYCNDVLAFPGQNENFQWVPWVIRNLIKEMFFDPDPDSQTMINRVSDVERIFTDPSYQNEQVDKIVKNNATREELIEFLDFYESKKYVIEDTNKRKVVEENYFIATESFISILSRIRENLLAGYSAAAKKQIGLVKKIRTEMGAIEQLAIYRMKLLADSGDISIDFRQNAINQISRFEKDPESEVQLLSITDHNIVEARFIQNEINAQKQYLAFLADSRDSSWTYDESLRLFPKWHKIEQSLAEIKGEDKQYYELIVDSFPEYSKHADFFSYLEQQDKITEQLDQVINNAILQENKQWPVDIRNVLQGANDDLFRDERIGSIGRFDTLVKNKQYFEALKSVLLEKFSSWKPTISAEKMLGFLIMQEAKELLGRGTSKAELEEIKKSLVEISNIQNGDDDLELILTNINSKIDKADYLEQKIARISEFSSIEELNSLYNEIKAVENEGTLFIGDKGFSYIYESLEYRKMQIFLQQLKQSVLDLKTELVADTEKMTQLVENYDELVKKTKESRDLFSGNAANLRGDNSAASDRVQKMLDILDKDSSEEVIEKTFDELKKCSTSGLSRLEELGEYQYDDSGKFEELKGEISNIALTAWEQYKVNEYSKHNRQARELVSKWVNISNEPTYRIIEIIEPIIEETIAFLDQNNINRSSSIIQELDLYCNSIFINIWNATKNSKDKRIEEIIISLGLLIVYFKMDFRA